MHILALPYQIQLMHTLLAELLGWNPKTEHIPNEKKKNLLRNDHVLSWFQYDYPNLYFPPEIQGRYIIG